METFEEKLADEVGALTRMISGYESQRETYTYLYDLAGRLKSEFFMVYNLSLCYNGASMSLQLTNPWASLKHIAPVLDTIVSDGYTAVRTHKSPENSLVSYYFRKDGHELTIYVYTSKSAICKIVETGVRTIPTYSLVCDKEVS